MKPSETVVYPDNFINPSMVDIEHMQGNFYHAYNHALSAAIAVPKIKELLYFKISMMHNDIIDVN